MHVVEMQHVVVANLEIHALRESRLACFPAQVVLLMMEDGKVRQHHVAEQCVPEMTGRRHDPAHAQRRPNVGGLALLKRTRANHFLERDDVGIDGRQDGGNALGTCTSVETATTVDVIGDDPEFSRPCAACLRYLFYIGHLCAGMRLRVSIGWARLSPAAYQCTLPTWHG
jgi:hypothetical protein